MEEVKLTQSFAKIVQYYKDEGFGATEIAKMIGYTSTSQLNNSLENKSTLSAKAIITMIERLNVNPLYLFLGKGDMFLKESEETEFTKLFNEYNRLNERYSEAMETIERLTEEKEKIERISAGILGNTTEMIEYYQSISNKRKKNMELKSKK